MTIKRPSDIMMSQNAMVWEYLRPYAVNRSYMRTGAVIGLYATMITAPNSLMALAVHITEPNTILRQIRGKVTRKKVDVMLAPRLLEAFSSFSGIFSKPAFTVLI